jgi:purine nucleosidase
MPRKVIIDCDPGIDDAVALCLALFDPRLEVVAVTAAEGNVSAEQSTRNVQAIVEQIDPPKYPRVGTASPCTGGPIVDARHIHGENGLGNTEFAVSQLHHRHPSDKIICDEVRAAPNEVTIVCLGPLTNLACAFRRDPDLPSIVNRVIITGGCVDGVGNITPSAEFNIYCDPESARRVFRSPTTKTLIPLDLTRQLKFNLDFVDQLPDQFSRVGRFLRGVVPFLFRSYHQAVGQESIHLHDAVGVMAAVQPELFRTQEMAGDVETRGNLTLGATVFDRRPNHKWSINMEVAMDVELEALRDSISRGIKYAGQQTE